MIKKKQKTFLIYNPTNLVFKVVCIILTVFLNGSLFAQVDTLQKQNCTINITGKTLDEHDKSILSYATIYILELKTGAISNENGYFKIEGLCAGKYTFKISHVGCDPIEKIIEIIGDTVINFYTEHHSELLMNVDIVAERPIDQTTQTKIEIPIEKLDQSKGLSLGDALKNVPGVTTLNTGSSISKPIIHGLHSNRILILNNGIRQEGQQWGIEHAPEIDPFIANKISIIKGANSVRYGSDAIAGVVLIETKPLRDSAGIGGELNLIGMTNGRSGTASAYIDGNFNKLKSFSWRAQGTLKQNGNVFAPNYYLINTGLKEYNFSYALAWTKKKYGLEIFYSQFNTTLGIFGASHIGNLTDLESAFTSPVPIETGGFTYEIGRPYQHIEHELFKVKTYFLTGDKGRFSLVYARQYNLRYEYDKHRPLSDSLAGLNHPELQFEITSHTIDLVWEHFSVNHFSGSIGVSGITQGNTYEGRALIPNFRNYSGGLFWIERWKKNKFEIEGGVRYDYKWLRIYKYEYIGNATYELISPIRTFENISGNVGAIYKKDSTLNLSINFGSAWRAPSVSELYSDGLHHGAAAIEYGNRNLQTEVAYTGIFTARYSPSKKLFIEVSAYYNFIRNFIYRQPTAEPILTIRGAFPGFNYEQANATFKGCDFYLNYKFFKSFEITGKASILRAWNKTENNWLIMMPSDRYEAELTYRFKKGKRLSDAYISTSALFVTKQWRVEQNVDFAPPPAQYLLVNFHASCSIRFGHQKIEFGVSVFNLLNESYRDYLDRFRYFTDAMGRNISFRIKVPFNANFKKK